MTKNNDKVIENINQYQLMKSKSQGGPWIVSHIGQGEMVDDWWQSAPGKIAAPLNLTWVSEWKKCVYLSDIYRNLSETSGIYAYLSRVNMPQMIG